LVPRYSSDFPQSIVHQSLRLLHSARGKALINLAHKFKPEIIGTSFSYSWTNSWIQVQEHPRKKRFKPTYVVRRPPICSE